MRGVLKVVKLLIPLTITLQRNNLTKLATSMMMTVLDYLIFVFDNQLNNNHEQFDIRKDGSYPARHRRNRQKPKKRGKALCFGA
jgi:hypothetical protein